MSVMMHFKKTLRSYRTKWKISRTQLDLSFLLRIKEFDKVANSVKVIKKDINMLKAGNKEVNKLGILKRI